MKIVHKYFHNLTSVYSIYNQKHFSALISQLISYLQTPLATKYRAQITEAI
jgi:hypothetical protein